MKEMANTVKIYEIYGYISCRLKFSLGKAIPFEAYFDGGIPDKNIPASYMATTTGRQIAIEQSPLFKSGVIRLKKQKVQERTSPSENNSLEPRPKESTNEGATYPEVKTLVDAIALLKSEYGVSASRLKSEASVLRVAEEKNVSFPNLKS